jgi:dTDP-4-dehydrorhamnose reductase
VTFSLDYPLEVKDLKYAVIGSSGMFGRDMIQYLSGIGLDVSAFNRHDLDLEQTIDQLAKKLDHHDFLINAVAYTAVDQAETDTEAANRVNGEYAGKLAAAARLIGSRLIHISTDYVFSGQSDEAKRSPYKVVDIPIPQSAYGKSKLLGENLIRDSGASFSIHRTAWLYGANGKCFPKEIWAKKQSGLAIEVVNDQFGQPTWTLDLAQQVVDYSRLDSPVDIIHSVASGEATWFEFANEILGGGYSIKPVKTIHNQIGALRPQWSVLDNSSNLINPIGNWRDRWREARFEVLGLTEQD